MIIFIRFGFLASLKQSRSRQLFPAEAELTSVNLEFIPEITKTECNYLIQLNFHV